MLRLLYLFKQHDDISIMDKICLYERDVIKNLDGGSALHLNFNEAPRKEVFAAILDCMAMEGCNYFTINIPRFKCEDCDHLEGKTIEVCPKCGSKNLSKATRVIGYEQWVKAFSKERRIEESTRKYERFF